MTDLLALVRRIQECRVIGGIKTQAPSLTEEECVRELRELVLAAELADTKAMRAYFKAQGFETQGIALFDMMRAEHGSALLDHPEKGTEP